VDSFVNKRVAIKFTFRTNRPRRSVFLRGLLFPLLFIQKRGAVFLFVDILTPHPVGELLFITKKRSCFPGVNCQKHYYCSSFDKEELARSD
jgi:hypothetical protein